MYEVTPSTYEICRGDNYTWPPFCQSTKLYTKIDKSIVCHKILKVNVDFPSNYLQIYSLTNFKHDIRVWEDLLNVGGLLCVEMFKLIISETCIVINFNYHHFEEILYWTDISTLQNLSFHSVASAAKIMFADDVCDQNETALQNIKITINILKHTCSATFFEIKFLSARIETKSQNIFVWKYKCKWVN